MTDIASTPDTKPFYASQTIWSAIAVIGASAGGAYLALKTGDMASLGASLTAIIGGVTAIAGRLRATKAIG